MKFLRTFFDLIKDLIRRYFEHDVGQSGGQIAYFSLLSVFPFIVYMNTLLAFINVSGKELLGFISSLLPPEITEFLDIYIADIATVHTKSIISLSVFATVYSAYRVMRCLENAVGKAYGCHEKRGVLQSFIFSVLCILCLVTTSLALIILSVLSENIIVHILSASNISNSIVPVLMNMKWVVSFAVMFVGISLFYYYMPVKKIKYRFAIPGTVTTILGILIFSVIFNFYIRFASGFSIIYSSIGAVFILIFWLYFAGVILVMGAEINSAIEKITPLKK